jgi:hypothetical protein
MNIRTDREGFALPMAILVIGFMTAGIVAASTRVGAEAQTVDNHRAQLAVFACAEAGLARYMLEGRLLPSVTTTTATYTCPGGSATVTALRLRDDTGAGALVLVSSRGQIASGAGRPPTERTVAQLARQERIQMQVRSSWTSLSGVHANGNNGDFDGTDGAGTTCGDGVTRAGISVPTGTATGTGLEPQHIQNRAIGEPPIEPLGTQQEAADAITIDWASIVNPAAPAIPPDLIRCGGTTSNGYIAGFSPCATTWPSAATFENYPTIMINGSMDLPDSGKGLLIVTGDLRILGNQNWDGIILVGGKITDNGQGEISGSVVSGLNVKLGQTVEESQVDVSVANGTKRYNFNSCSVQNALAGATAGMRPIPNAWVDNWSTW